MRYNLLVKYFLISLSLVILASLSLFFWYSQSLTPISQNSDPISFVIAKSETGTSVISRLSQNNLIKSPLAVKIYLKLNPKNNTFKPGGFVLKKNMSVSEIVGILTKGPKDLWVTIPEGWRREQVAERLKATIQGFDSKQFISITQNLEGQLFPDTYLLPAEATPEQVVKIMVSNFTKKTQLNPQLPKDRSTLILASLIEREAKSDPDRQIVGGIIAKRLQNDWPLQIDATVQYAANKSPDWWAPIFDTKYPSAYNTYLQTGFPPSPICSPGLASINAAKNPQESSYWYYITGNDGITYYAKTLTEHNINISKHLR